MTSGLRAYQHYLALKKHFTQDKYNVFDQPRVPVPEATFLKRNDRWLWEKLAENVKGLPQLMTYMIANFVYGNDNFLYDTEKATEKFVKWQRDEQMVTRLFEVELDRIQRNCTDAKALLEFQGASPPVLLNMYLGGYLSIQTMVILDAYLNYLEDWKGSMSFLFEGEIRRIDKSRKFIKFNKEKTKKVIEAFCEDLEIVV